MIKEIETIKTNLEKYPSIKKFLGKIINQRLKIECYTHAMLTAHLLEINELTQFDLERLECTLKQGELHCENFNKIFQSKGLSIQSEVADGQIIDLLAEVKAFEFLHYRGFNNITNIPRTANTRTVDFTAKKSGQNYAIEVTRLGLAQSIEKQPVFQMNLNTVTQNKCQDANGFRISIITQGLNPSRLKREISDAIDSKYPQMKIFCLNNKDMEGVLFISSGRDYFAMSNYENKNYEITPTQDFLDALTEMWRSPKQEDLKDYISRIVITRGKDLKKAIVYPSLNNEEQTFDHQTL